MSTVTDSSALIDVLLGRISSKVGSRTVPSWFSEVQLVVYSYVKKALEATVEIKILSGSEVFDGQISAVPDSFLLYNRNVGGAMTVGDGLMAELSNYCDVWWQSQ
jgi:hypothetical protein